MWPMYMKLKETRICYPEIWLFDLRMILCWRWLRSSKYRKSTCSFCPEAGNKFSFYWRQTLISPAMAPKESANKLLLNYYLPSYLFTMYFSSPKVVRVFFFFFTNWFFLCLTTIKHFCYSHLFRSSSSCEGSHKHVDIQ